MKKAAIVLIVIAAGVIVAATLFIGGMEEPAPPPERDDTTLRNTSSGDVVGFIDAHGARAWMGVPYAEPPSGTLRWRSPRPVQASTEVIEALSHGNVCPQFASLLSGDGLDAAPGQVTGDEDCLYLNIWAPPNARDLPVMFWIHGGGNTIGHGGSYIGANLAVSQDVVVVTVNYRLGFFGWFNHPALHTGNPEDDSGNFGTLDLVRALEWTRDNIAAFGGDPGNVLVFGESAGGFDTLAMMASPLAEGLFHRAVVQSGGFNVSSLQVATEYEADGGHTNSAKELTAKLLLAEGRVGSIDEARTLQDDMGGTALRDFLYSKSPEEFFALMDGRGFGMINVPDNFGDSHVLPDMSTADIFSSADNHNMVPVILGTNRDEVTTFISRDPRYVDTFLGVFPSLKDEDAYRRTVHYQSSAWKVRGVDELAQYMTAAGNPDVYTYRWDWDEEPSLMGYDLSVALGAGHGLEIAFVFGEFEQGMGISYVYPHDEAQTALSNSMMSYWAEFAYNGNPGSGRDGSEVAWLSWGTDGKHSIILDSPADQGIFMDDAVVTYDSLKAEFAADATFASVEERCSTYVRTFRFGAWDEDHYRSMANGACRDVDPDSFGFF